MCSKNRSFQNSKNVSSLDLAKENCSFKACGERCLTELGLTLNRDCSQFTEQEKTTYQATNQTNKHTNQQLNKQTNEKLTNKNMTVKDVVSF